MFFQVFLELIQLLGLGQFIRGASLGFGRQLDIAFHHGNFLMHGGRIVFRRGLGEGIFKFHLPHSLPGGCERAYTQNTP